MAASQAAAGNAAAATTAAEAGWWVRASLYDAYELRASIAEVLADTARAAASTTASAPGGVLRSHTFVQVCTLPAGISANVPCCSRGHTQPQGHLV